MIDPAVVAERRRRLFAPELWLDRTVDSFLARHIAATPHKTAVAGVRSDGVATRRIDYAELGAMVDRAAGALRAMGVGHGDVVSMQLPNWWQFAVVALACARLGAACNPIVHILREREVRWIVEFSGSKVLIVPSTFRKFDYAAMARSVQAAVPTLRRVIVAGEDGPDGFEQALLVGPETVPYDAAAPAQRPDDLLVLMFTSGTTGEPKGVMHTSNTVLGHLLRTARALGLDADDVFFAATPLGHMTGYGHFVLLPLILGATTVLQDHHEPHRGLRIMDEEGVTFSAGATPFLADLVDCARADGIRPRRLRRFWCAGAPIPPALVRRAIDELGLGICSIWGMTEVTAGTMTEPEHPQRAAESDGRALPGIEVKVLGDSGREQPRGQTGRLLVRGASLFCGYLKRPEAAQVDADGWFDTGDLAHMDGEGYIRIAGRTKELLIRGGENVPVIEVENVLLGHPAIAEVAIVGMPDERLGERGCAFIVPREGRSIDLPAVQRYLDGEKLAKAFWPERVECVDALPKTASGKVQRFLLKQRAAGLSA
ncbi:MAG: AMP-binding protein [Rubrivivax sp.]